MTHPCTVFVCHRTCHLLEHPDGWTVENVEVCMGVVGAECPHKKAKGKSEHDELLGFFFLIFILLLLF